MQSPSRAAVKVPKVGKRESPGTKHPAIGRRRSASVIATHQKQLEAEISSQLEPPQTALGEAEKERLAMHMEFRGSPPDVLPSEDAESRNTQAAQLSGAQSQESGLESILKDITREIEDRQEHLEYITGCGKFREKCPTVRRLQFEIATRMQELRKMLEMNPTEL